VFEIITVIFVSASGFFCGVFGFPNRISNAVYALSSLTSFLSVQISVEASFLTGVRLSSIAARSCETSLFGVIFFTWCALLTVFS
jgi:hypothetical protein